MKNFLFVLRGTVSFNNWKKSARTQFSGRKRFNVWHKRNYLLIRKTYSFYNCVVATATITVCFFDIATGETLMFDSKVQSINQG